MNSTLALKIILGLSVAGMLFSGYLSYTELFLNKCLMGCTSVGKVPACVYGFIMYLVVFVIALLGVLDS